MTDPLARIKADHRKRLREIRRMEHVMWATLAFAVALALFAEPLAMWVRSW